LSVFESFKEGVLKIREAVEGFKDEHKMASEAISLVIESMPEPFNKFCSVIWNGLEKQGVDSSTKLLEILEKIENNTEQLFYEIKTNLSEVIQYGANQEDIQKLGEQIRISKDSVIQNLKQTFNEELRKASERLAERFGNSLKELHLLESNLNLMTVGTEFGIGSRDCWKDGFFRDEDIKSGYDARRPITDKIITSIVYCSRIGTMVYGKPYYGKTLILKRIMLELIDNGYAVVYGNGIQAQAQLIIQLLNGLTDRFPKVLVIADNVHRTGSEALFEAFNYFVRKKKSENIIRFLFAAREEEFKSAKEALEEREKAAEIDVALRNIYICRIDFSLEDAVLFSQKASIVTLSRPLSDENAKLVAKTRYDLARGDPFMFAYVLIAIISGNETSAPRDFLARDLDEKIVSLKEDEMLLKAALLCSFLGMFGIPIMADVLYANNIYINHLNALVAKGFLFQNGPGYETRHDLWILEFLIRVYNKDFDNDFVSFDAMYKIRDMISSILSRINYNYLINILTECAVLYREERAMPIAKVIVDNYIVPDHLNSNNKAEVYCFGLGNFHLFINQPIDAIRYYDKALELNPQCASALINKGNILVKLGKHKLGIQCYDKAIELDPNYGVALFNKGNAFEDLGKYDEAIKWYNKTTEIDPNYVEGWINKGTLLDKLGKHNEASQCYDMAIQIDPNNAEGWNNKGGVLYKLGNYIVAIKCVDRALQIDPNNAEGWNNKGNVLVKLGEHDVAIQCYDRAIEIIPNNAYVWHNKYRVLQKLRRYKEANQCLIKIDQLGMVEHFSI
jgi:tetratricopeptide (TPR) repeat protein